MKRLILAPFAVLLLIFSIAAIPNMIDKHLIPSADSTYNIGSQSKRWNEAFIGQITLGGQQGAEAGAKLDDSSLNIYGANGVTLARLRAVEGSSDDQALDLGDANGRNLTLMVDRYLLFKNAVSSEFTEYGVARLVIKDSFGTPRFKVDASASNLVVLMPALPTSNPNNAGQLWNDNGHLAISAGP